MKKFSIVVSLVISIGLVFIFWSPISRVLAQTGIPFFDSKPDLPALFSEEKEDESGVDMEDLLAKRAEAFGNLRGLNNGEEVDPSARARAVETMDRQQELLSLRPQSPEKSALLAAWSPIGPAPLAAGSARNSGRTISIAVHPTDANIVYVGTAQGGLYRSTDGGISWVPLMDGALSLAIGSIAISPSNPETIYIGTGEHNFSADSFFGVGVYRISNASTTAVLSGPFNRDAGNVDVFTGRGIGKIVVHPTDPNTIFVATTSGGGGISGSANTILPS